MKPTIKFVSPKPIIRLTLDYEESTSKEYFRIPATLRLTLRVNDRMFATNRAILASCPPYGIEGKFIPVWDGHIVERLYEEAWSEIYTAARQEGYLP